MRVPTLAILIVAAVLTATPAPAQTYDPKYPVCLQVYQGFTDYYFECAYTSLAQCDASASGRAGSGGTSFGRAPVVAGSVGADGFVSAPGVDCKGCVACAICAWRGVASCASAAPDMANPAATITPARSISLR